VAQLYSISKSGVVFLSSVSFKQSTIMNPIGGIMPNIFASQHPLVAHKLSKLRDRSTEPKKFRELVREISALLAYEATADLLTVPRQVETPLTSMIGVELKEKIGLVPILRAGLGMVEGIWELMPSAEVWHIGLYRDEKTLKPVQYYNKLPVEPTVSLCLILDPMLATGGSAVATTEIVKRWGVTKIKFVGLIGAPEGIAAMQKAHPDVPLYLAAVDDHLNERGYIVPGLGDAGDRQFGTA
jgi:uracil phosphoribosyltransferase